MASRRARSLGRSSSAAHFEQLRRYFGDKAIIELTGLLAFQNLSSKFNASLGVAPQGFCQVATAQESKTRGP
jgi:hypothetical protein